MIDRKSLLGILGMLPDDVLMKALSVAGSQSPEASGLTGFEGLSVDDGSNSIVPWQDKTIKYDGGRDRPAMVDKMWAKSAADEATQGPGPVPGRNLETDSDIYLQTGGT